MAKYRKKPVEIEAVQFPANAELTDEMKDHIGEADYSYSAEDGLFTITTLEGAMTVSPGDYVIKGVAGEMYPCKPDIFHQTYTRIVAWFDEAKAE